jgi:hypothetical protein
VVPVTSRVRPLVTQLPRFQSGHPPCSRSGRQTNRPGSRE